MLSNGIHIGRRGGVRLTGGDEWTPASVVGLGAWWHAGAITGLANNDPVASWLDSSGNGYTATQDTAGSRPLYITNAINGQPALRFDGTDDSLVNASFAWSASDHTWYVVWKENLYNVGDRVFGDGGADCFYGLTMWNSSFFKEYSMSGYSQKIPVPTTPAIAQGRRTTKGLSINRDTEITGTYPFPVATTGIIIGGVATLYGAVDIAELIVYTADVAVADRNLIWTYLATKYNVTLA